MFRYVVKPIRTYIFYNPDFVNASEVVYFNITEDLMVFLHIEKVGGSKFELKLVNNLTIYYNNTSEWKLACNKKKENVSLLPNSTDNYENYYCPRMPFKNESVLNATFSNNWLVCRPTISWPCGVHPDYPKLNSCMQKAKIEGKIKGKIHYITLLREPILRYISEWRHIVRSINKYGIDSPFKTSNICNKEVSMTECMPFELGKRENKTISLEEYILCNNNIGTNRQTRLLANYYHEKDGCNLFKRENRVFLLESAKNVLKNMSFFGLTEYEDQSQKLFEKTFNKTFKINNIVKRRKRKHGSIEIYNLLNATALETVKKLNILDVELYDYAKNLFFQRLVSQKIYFKIETKPVL